MDKLDDAQVKKVAIGAAGVTLALGALLYMTRPAKKAEEKFEFEKNDQGKFIVTKKTASRIFAMIMDI